ncbi:hypothetical protein CYFUS_003307 [Cystobacter fuscus]|uniref:Uncharacterized protein n=1 Tax=Cystobacter fuscus TaxID=43 RepID=A0A250J2Z6_9BACT|nr:hypothetical protein [Cystobacter fuscus]ATB37882.1 hypothetical protein CYFUS_003307 [Cystobacter fuscus]
MEVNESSYQGVEGTSGRSAFAGAALGLAVLCGFSPTSAHALNMLKTSGRNIMDSTTGATVRLRGVNLGGWLVHNGSAAQVQQGATNQGRYVVPILKHGRCAFEFYAADASTPASIALGRHSDAEELSWYAELERVRGRWKVLRLVFDDLERP